MWLFVNNGNFLSPVGDQPQASHRYKSDKKPILINEMPEEQKLLFLNHRETAFVVNKVMTYKNELKETHKCDNR